MGTQNRRRAFKTCYDSCRHSCKSALFHLLFLFFMSFLPLTSAAEDLKQVVIIRYPIEFDQFRNAIGEFKAVLAQNGFVEGVNIQYVDILTRTSDESSVPEIKEAVQRYKNTASLFVTCGWVSLYVRESLKSSDTPQIFLPVLDSVALKLVPSLTMPPNTNITGVYLRYPPEKVTRLAVNLMPRIKNFAYVYDSRIPADVVYKASFEGMKGGHGGLTLHYIDLAKGIDAAIQALKDRHIEAMCFIVGGFQHLKPLKKAGIPIVSAFTLDMDEQSLKVFLMDDDSILAGLFNPFSVCGREAGEMAVSILKGAEIQKISPVPAKQKAFINLKAAHRFGLKIPMEILETVDYVIK